MNKVDVVAKTLVSLAANNGLSVRLTKAIPALEREFGFEEMSLDNAVDRFLVPRVLNVGNYNKVCYNGNVYYYHKSFLPKFDIEFMNSSQAVKLAAVVIDSVNNKILKNRFFDVAYIFDEWLENKTNEID